MIPLRQCRDCGTQAWTDEDLELFRTNTRSRYGKDNHCKVCHQKAGRDYWKYGNGRNTRLKQYGITADQYDEMYTNQKGCCKICGMHSTEVHQEKEFLSVDHCHNTGQVRGLLCDSCNLGLGKFYDSITNLENAIKYLTKGKGN